MNDSHAPRQPGARLDLDTLRRVPREAQPVLDPRDRPIRIAHLGLGAFHRAHQAVYTELAGDWGISAASPRSADAARVLAAQDGLYSVTRSSPEGTATQVVGAIRETGRVGEGPDGADGVLLPRLANPRTAVLTLTVTEKGYRRDPRTGGLDQADPEIVADRAGRHPPRTAVGQLVAGLRARHQRGGAELTVLCCDNMPHNGRVLTRLVDDYLTGPSPAGPGPDTPGSGCSGVCGAGAGVGTEALRAWIAEHVTFPCSMVDRITPAATDDDREYARHSLDGLVDAAAVLTEPFRQWVIEDRFAGSRPEWERAGALLASDVTGYEQVKLRALNGTHSLLAYLGALAGVDTIADAARRFDGVARRLLNEDTLPSLRAPDGLDLPAYADSVLRRFANPTLRHRSTQVAMDGSQKLPQRLLETVRQRRAAGAEPGMALFAVAAWMRYVSAGRTDTGAPINVDDPLADRLARLLEGAREPAVVVDRLLGAQEVFGELAEDGTVRALLVAHLSRIGGSGAEAAARAVARG